MVLKDLNISDDRPVLIAGPTASGKSALAMRIAEAQGGVIINADAIQVYDNWRVLTARPSAADEAAIPHQLFGHVAYDQPYSAGQWLRDIDPLLEGKDRPIIVGGTGLYFAALTEGLAEIPQTPDHVRAKADDMRQHGETHTMIDQIDAETKARIDLKNPMRVQRAWEVQQTTGQGLAKWQDMTPPPRLPLQNTHAFVLDAEKEWLNLRIEKRFTQMLEGGALAEAEANRDRWDPALPSAKAIGAEELIAYLNGEMTLDEARQAATTATRQFAKRQRTWFRSRMSKWASLNPQKI